jgi:hypothetical protein
MLALVGPVDQPQRRIRDGLARYLENMTGRRRVAEAVRSLDERLIERLRKSCGSGGLFGENYSSVRSYSNTKIPG